LARKSIFELAANSSAVCGEIMKKNAPYGAGKGERMYNDCKPEKINSYIKNIYICPEWIYVIITGIAMVLVPILLFCCGNKMLHIQPARENSILKIQCYDSNAAQTGRVTTTANKEIPNDNPYFFLFLITLLGFEGAGVFFICMYCREKTKYALLTYAYDEALEQVGERCDKKTIIIPGKGFDRSKTKETRYEARAITRIFESYCQNITTK